MARRKRPEDDDGRVIAPMNVDGMPWYSGAPREEQPPAGEQRPDDLLPPRQEPLTGPEKRAFTWGVLKAAMLVAGVFILVYLAFLLFCVFVWFK